MRAAASPDAASRYYPRLRRYRRAAGLTQLDLARRAGYRSATVVSRVERGGYVGAVAERLIARALGLSGPDYALAFGYPGMSPIDLSTVREERRPPSQTSVPVSDRVRPGSRGQEL